MPTRFARTGLLLVLVAVIARLLEAPGQRPAAAADLSQFRAGDIISDAMFFDGAAMAAGDIQRLLDAKGTACTAGSDGAPCLKAYRQDTPSTPADGLCAAYPGAPGEPAAVIIEKIGRVCGVSQRALLVMLQKEQGLVTITRPNWTRYQKAMGMGCPDTAACDTRYYWFFNQVYGAAKQFRRYAANPSGYGYKAGMVNQIRWSPNAACGSAPVFLFNQATAGLYNYTPYQPNPAALAAGYGTGDGCSAYGNRNFFNYFTDWFGSTHEPGAAQISALYYRLGPNAVGTPSGGPACGLVGGGCVQYFTGGTIYWSPASGAHFVFGAIRSTWGGTGWEWGVLGYPTTDELVAADGVGRLQWFQGGVVFWSPATGAYAVRAAMLNAWIRHEMDRGLLGYPTSAEGPAAGGSGQVQSFQGGRIFWSPSTGAYPVRGAIGARWTTFGAEAGVLGYPASDEEATPDGQGTVQRFQRGSIVWSAGTGANPVWGAVAGAWTKTGAVAGALGYPVGPEAAGAAGGVEQRFTGGTVYWSQAYGAHPVVGPLAAGYAARGGSAGPLGLPTTDPQPAGSGRDLVQAFEGGLLFTAGDTATVAVLGSVLGAYQAVQAQNGLLGLPVADESDAPGGGRVQQFSGGAVYASSATGAHVVRGGVAAAWQAAGGPAGPLGYPTSGETALGPDRVMQRFTGGAVYWSAAAGAHAVSGSIGAAYAAAGGPAGPLQMPAGDEADAPGSGRAQQFQGGAVYASASGAYPVRGGIGIVWQAAGGPTGVLGYPTGSESAAGNGGAGQRFTGGGVYWLPTAGAHAVTGSIDAAYTRAGGPPSVLGLPTGAETAIAGGRVQPFQGGSIYATTAGGAHPVRGAIGAVWLGAGGLTSALGYPTSDETAAGAGVVQQFHGGAIYWSAGTGTHVVRGAIAGRYAAFGGAAGLLGLPTTDERSAASSAQEQLFQGGAIYWTPDGGAHVVRGGIGAAWRGYGGLTGSLGYPTTDEAAVGAGTMQRFSGGVLYWTPASGVHRLTAAVYDAWQAAGGATGALGEPVGDVRTESGGIWADFQHGHVLVLPGQAPQVVVS